MEVVNTGTISALWDANLAINEVGEHIFSTNAPVNNDAVTVDQGDSLSVYFFIDDANDRGFTHNVNYVRISASSANYTPTGGTASFTLDLDETNLTFDGTIEDNFVGGSTATEALQHIGNSARHQTCLLYTSPSPRDRQKSRMPSSA